VDVADDKETKGDLANRTFKDIRTAVKSGEALFRTSTSIGGDRDELTNSEGYWSRFFGRQADAYHC